MALVNGLLFSREGERSKGKQGIERYVDDCQLIAIAKAFVCRNILYS